MAVIAEIGSVGMAGDGAVAVENGGDHSPAVAEDAVIENGGDLDHAPAEGILALAVPAAVEAMGSGGATPPAVAADGEMEGAGGDPDPAPAPANGGNALDAKIVAAARFGGVSGRILLHTRGPIRRCSYTYRILRDLVKSEDFLRFFNQNRSLHPMPLLSYRQTSPLDDHVQVQAVDIEFRRSVPVFRFHHPHLDSRTFRIEGSSDGILLVSCSDRLYACNPCNCCWARLPPLHLLGAIVAFYGRDLADGREHMVLYYERLENKDCRYWTFSLTNNVVRCIGQANLESIRAVLRVGITPSYDMPPIEVERKLHWRAQAEQSNSNLLTFDTVQEKFEWILPPRVQEGSMDVHVKGDQLFNIKGKLAMTVVTPQVVTVWVLENYFPQDWEHMYTIKMPVAELQEFHGSDEDRTKCATVFVLLEDGNVLIQSTHTLLQCNADGTVLETYHLSDSSTLLSRHMLQESIVSRPFLSTQDGDPFIWEP